MMSGANFQIYAFTSLQIELSGNVVFARNDAAYLAEGVGTHP
jgi:hypothetical protein